MITITYKKLVSVIVILLLCLFTFAGCKSDEQIQLLSNKVAELEKNNEKLSSELAELKKSNEKLNSENADLKKGKEKLVSEKADLEKNKEEFKSEIEELKSNNQKLIESNNVLQTENADLKKKLEASDANKQEPAPANKETSKETSNETDKIAYLTFDDGPSDNTVKVLDILKENNIKATFFVTGHPDKKALYQRIVKEGHTIGNHTYTHDYAALYKTIEGFNKDKQALEDLIFSAAGVRPQILRFPGGSNNHVSYKYGGTDFMDKLTKYEKDAGIKYFDWNVSSGDATVVPLKKDVIASNVLSGAKNKKQAIILMHDSKPRVTTVEALPAIIKGLKDQGFKFSALSPEVTPVQFK